MAYIELNTEKLQQNFKVLDTLFKANGIEWAIVTKLLCGEIAYLEKVVALGGVTEFCDSRISNLAKLKEIKPEVETVYIKPPAQGIIEEVIRYADVSFNSSLSTMKWLSAEAVKQNKLHKVVIMIELGDLREGVMGDDLMDFYEAVFKLPNIKITGIGSNFNCLHGVMPSEDKLVQLSLYKQLIEAKFNVKISWVTGGTSVVIPLLKRHSIPAGINHFRVGETLYFGADLLGHGTFEDMHDDVFKLYAQIIEINDKPKVPIGVLEANPSGEVFEIDADDYGKMSRRGIVDVGLLDTTSDLIFPEDECLRIIGASSDMIILDLEKAEGKYKVGDYIPFKLKYMGALGLFNSDYIEKRIV